MFNRTQVETLNQQLHNQHMEMQKELNIQNSFVVPDGYELIEKNKLNLMLKE